MYSMGIDICSNVHDHNIYHMHALYQHHKCLSLNVILMSRTVLYHLKCVHVEQFYGIKMCMTRITHNQNSVRISHKYYITYNVMHKQYTVLMLIECKVKKNNFHVIFWYHAPQNAIH